MTIMDMIRQVIERLRETKYSSAGGDSPKINFVKEFPEIQYQDFDEIIRNEVKRIIEEERQEPTKEGTQIEKEVGTSSDIESGAIGAVRTGTGLAQNPASSIGMLLKFIPHASLVILALAMIPIIIEELKRPGSLMDVRWKRMMTEEFNAFLDRQDQMNTELGYRQVIVQSKAGFIANSSGAGTYDTNRDRREGGMDKDRQQIMGLPEHAIALPKTAFYNG